MDPCTYFSGTVHDYCKNCTKFFHNERCLLMSFLGSSVCKYEGTKQLEIGFGSSIYHSITAMNQYAHRSTEEIRLEDYKASGGFFGSSFAKLAGALCVRPGRKLRPYCYGEMYHAALNPFINQKTQQDNKCAKLPAWQTESALRCDELKSPNQIQRSSNVNLCFHGKQNIDVLVNCIGDSNVNFSFDNAVPPSVSVQLKSTEFEQTTNHAHRKYVPRSDMKLKEKFNGSSSSSAKNDNVKSKRKR